VAMLAPEEAPMRKSIVLAAILVLAACNNETQNAEGKGTPASSVQPNAAPSVPADPNNIVNIAGNSKDHTTLVTALKAADYIDAVSNAGPFTVFAPTNDAFAKLPPGTVDGLLKKEKQGDLKNILQYHVTVSTYAIKDLKEGQVLSMANNGKVTVHVKDGKTMVNDATIVASVPASNGIVHVIDGVLLPK
jgi:uncharacterized surface protein with fasciclin (FAS1) repeats